LIDFLCCNLIRMIGNSMDQTIDALKALVDPGRLRIFWLLAHIDERICVTEAMDVLGVSHYNASRMLSVLKHAGLVTYQREGKRVYYTLNQSGNPFIKALIVAVREIPAAGFEQEIARCRHQLCLRDAESPPLPGGTNDSKI